MLRIKFLKVAMKECLVTHNTRVITVVRRFLGYFENHRETFRNFGEIGVKTVLSSNRTKKRARTRSSCVSDEEDDFSIPRISSRLVSEEG